MFNKILNFPDTILLAAFMRNALNPARPRISPSVVL